MNIQVTSKIQRKAKMFILKDWNYSGSAFLNEKGEPHRFDLSIPKACTKENTHFTLGRHAPSIYCNQYASGLFSLFTNQTAISRGERIPRRKRDPPRNISANDTWLIGIGCGNDCHFFVYRKSSIYQSYTEGMHSYAPIQIKCDKDTAERIDLFLQTHMNEATLFHGRTPFPIDIYNKYCLPRTCKIQNMEFDCIYLVHYNGDSTSIVIDDGYIDELTKIRFLREWLNPYQKIRVQLLQSKGC